MDKKIHTVINNYVSNILKVDNENKTLDDKLNSINELTDSLIDYCIKNKIMYFIENKIGYSAIVYNFKSHLAKFLKNLIDPTDKILKKYIGNNSIEQNWDNVSDINTLMFKNFKNLNETFEKNVSFVDNFEQSNIQLTQSNLIDSGNSIDLNNLSLYIKLLFNQKKYVVEFIDKITAMCNILANNDIKYKKNNPYD